MATRTEQRPVEVKICDFCNKEVPCVSKCVVCQRDMCGDGGCHAHAAYSLEIYRYENEKRICSAHVCKECAQKRTNLTIGALLDGILTGTLGSETVVAANTPS